jgi:hypothetical protein
MSDGTGLCGRHFIRSHGHYHDDRVRPPCQDVVFKTATAVQ